MPRIHLVEKGNLKLRKSLGPTSIEWESGYWWRIGQANANALKGGDIYFHKSQSAPSHEGGKIIDYRIEDQGQYNGRYVFIYCPAADHIGVRTGQKNWSRFKKII
jgi:hypothetical protein